MLKARVVNQGFRQKLWINYFDTYSSVARISTIRLLIALASIHNLIIHQMDIKTTFLNGELDEEVELTKEFLSSRFDMKDMGEVNVMLGIRIKHEMSILMDTSEKIRPNNSQDVSQLGHSRIIRCLMYAMTCTRLDIAFAAGKLGTLAILILSTGKQFSGSATLKTILQQMARRLNPSWSYFIREYYSSMSKLIREWYSSEIELSDREHSKVLELEAEVLKRQHMLTESEKRCAFLENKHVNLQLKFQKYKECLQSQKRCDSSNYTASNTIFVINKLKDQLQGRDKTIKNLQAQHDIVGLLNVGPTDGRKALETELTQLKDTITALRIQNDGKKHVTFKEPPKPSPRVTKKPVALQVKKANVAVHLSIGIKSATGASKTAFKNHAWIYKKLPAKSMSGEKVEDHLRNLNKQNRVDSHFNAKRLVSISNLNAATPNRQTTKKRCAFLNYDREHSKVLKLEAEVLKRQHMLTKSEKRCAFLENKHLKDQLQGKDKTIRNLQAQHDIVSLLNVGPTDGRKALETELTQLKDTITALRIQNDGFKVTNATQKTEIAKLKAKDVGNKSSGTTTPTNPKVLAPRMYAIGIKSATGASKLPLRTMLGFIRSCRLRVRVERK
nr:zinc finger, CCHC-type [Tanacetum cinerariifolium]